MNRKHSPKHSPKDSPKHPSPRHSDTLAGAPAPLPLWEKGLRNAQASSPAQQQATGVQARRLSPRR